jgi:hypothetical protein
MTKQFLNKLLTKFFGRSKCSLLELQTNLYCKLYISAVRKKKEKASTKTTSKNK